MQWLEDTSDTLADVLFAERPLTKPEQLRAFRLRTALSHLRRVTEPMRAVLTDLIDNPPPVPKGKGPDRQAVRRWKLVAEHHTRVANAADALRESLSSLFDTSLALADVRLQPDHEEARRLGRDPGRADAGDQLRRDERGLSAGRDRRRLLGLSR